MEHTVSLVFKIATIKKMIIKDNQNNIDHKNHIFAERKVTQNLIPCFFLKKRRFGKLKLTI